jgi:hypothetical protein
VYAGIFPNNLSNQVANISAILNATYYQSGLLGSVPTASHTFTFVLVTFVFGAIPADLSPSFFGHPAV